MIVMQSLADGFYVIKEARADHSHTENFQLIQIRDKIEVLHTASTVSECEDAYKLAKGILKATYEALDSHG